MKSLTWRASGCDKENVIHSGVGVLFSLKKYGVVVFASSRDKKILASESAALYEERAENPRYIFLEEGAASGLLFSP